MSNNILKPDVSDNTLDSQHHLDLHQRGSGSDGGGGGEVVSGATKNKLLSSKGWYWVYVPWLNFVAWINAGSISNNNTYFIYALIYSIPTIFGVFFGESSFIIFLEMVSWIIGIIHAQSEKNKISKLNPEEVVNSFVPTENQIISFSAQSNSSKASIATGLGATAAVLGISALAAHAAQNKSIDPVAIDLDQDGRADGVACDRDGDGRLDTVIADTNGDGIVDSIIVDSDGDGKLDTIATDVNADGLLDVVAADTDGNGIVDAVAAVEGGDEGGGGLLESIFSLFG